MGHIVFGAPDLADFHLHERLARELQARGHRTTVLCLDRTAFTFWCQQGLATVLLHRCRPIATRVPVAEVAEHECRRRGARSTRCRRRTREALDRLLPAVLRWFEHDRPDLLLLHQKRTGAHRLLHFVARELGTRTLWTGDGMLPHTMQFDEEGIDGDARVGRRSAWDFRLLGVDEPFLAAALAAALGRNLPPPLARRQPRRVPWLLRAVDAVADAVAASDLAIAARMQRWQAALPAPPPLPGRIDLPPTPFVAVLLQREDEDRLHLDAAAPPAPHVLAAAVQASARAIDPALRTVAVLPHGGLLAAEMARLRRVPGLHLETADADLAACVAATAVVTVNAPGATAALLAGTPVVHLGRALWGIPGVATPARLDTLAADLPRALLEQQPELQRRFLTWLLRHGHLWCSPTDPDFNGLSGLVLEIERRLARPAPLSTRLHYRPGPAWPLAAEGRA